MNLISQKSSPNLEPKEESYKIWLTSSEAIEIHINNLTHPSSNIEIFDSHGTKLAKSIFTPNSPIVLPFFPMKYGLYLIKLTVGPDPDPKNVYQLHIDKYTRLSGTITGSCFLTAQKGPLHDRT
ncbi:hypothetical protein ACQCN2_10930 [Brevibacillus ginsengisoli]|uniref:hypothetical protein n=1 Tax=Brevibacillus ginsengisoli TaxID=363854 RepID=UPI003CED3F98